MSLNESEIKLCMILVILQVNIWASSFGILHFIYIQTEKLNKHWTNCWPSSAHNRLSNSNKLDLCASEQDNSMWSCGGRWRSEDSSQAKPGHYCCYFYTSTSRYIILLLLLLLDLYLMSIPAAANAINVFHMYGSVHSVPLRIDVAAAHR